MVDHCFICCLGVRRAYDSYFKTLSLVSMTSRTKKQFDYFPLYFWDFERDTEHLSDAEKMGYLRILAHLYKNGGTVPDDTQAIKKYARFNNRRGALAMSENIRELLTSCLKAVDGSIITVDETTANVVDSSTVEFLPGKFLTQKRVVETIKKIEHIQKVNQERALKAAKARWRNRK